VADDWVCNASPVICLAKVGCSNLLMDLPNRLVVPAGVAGEIQAGPASDPGAQWIRGPGAVYVQSAPDPIRSVANWDLGLGETQVIETAISEGGLTVVVDDRVARNCAAAHGLRCIGTFGIIILAKNAGLVHEVRPLLAELRAAGLRVDEPLAQRVLDLAGEGA